MKHDVVLVLTGCVRPNITDDVLVIKDVETRKNQYLTAIKWYLTNTTYKVVFCENSGYEFGNDLSVLYGGRFEYLSYTASNINNNRGKGYKEMEILEYVFNHSEFYKQGNLFVKITGRLILLNICKIVTKLDRYNCEFVSAYLYGRRIFSDSRFIFFTKNYFPFLLAQKENIKDWRMNFEYNLFLSIMYAKKENIKFIYPFMAERVHGIGGGFGISYDMNDWAYMRKNCRHQLKRLLFNIGILPIVSQNI